MKNTSTASDGSRRTGIKAGLGRRLSHLLQGHWAAAGRDFPLEFPQCKQNLSSSKSILKNGLCPAMRQERGHDAISDHHVNHHPNPYPSSKKWDYKFKNSEALTGVPLGNGVKA